MYKFYVAICKHYMLRLTDLNQGKFRYKYQSFPDAIKFLT